MMGVMLQTAFLVIAILAVQKLLGDKLHAYVRYGLWLLVVLRLLVPMNFIDSPISMLHVTGTMMDWQEDLLQADKTFQEAGSNLPQIDNVPQGADTDYAEDVMKEKHDSTAENIGWANGNLQTGHTQQTEAVGRKERNTARRINIKLIQSAVTEAYLSGAINKILYAIWLIGSLLVGGFLSFCYIRFRRRLRKSQEAYTKVLPNTIKENHIPVYSVKGLETPCLVGLVHPAIYIGTNIDMTTNHFRYALAHENVHYLHRDHIWAFVRAALVTVYWFHPFVWIAAALSVRDGEIACDYGTVRRFGQEERFAYGEMLLSLSKIQRGKRVYSYGTMLRPSKSELKRRILRLTQTNGNRAWAGILAVMLMVIVAGCAFTGMSEADGGDVGQEVLTTNEADIDIADAAADNSENTAADSGNARAENEKSDQNEDSLDNEDTYNMEPRQLEVKSAEISGDTPFGADGPYLDYAGGMGTDQGSRIIFHDYFGLIVYDLDNWEITRSLDLASIGCDKTQGDDYCQVAVSEDGAIVWLHPKSKRYMYRYEVEENLLYQEPLVKTFELDLETKELFDRYSTFEEESSSYWHSNYLYEEYKDAEGLHKADIFLYVLNAQDGSEGGLVLHNLECAWDDMMFMLFKDGVEVPDADGFPYNYDGYVEYVEITYDKPCNYTRISAAFGGRTHPITGEITLHEGIDFVAAEGTDITAAADGVVYETGYSAKYGNYVALLHANGEMTYYCQCKEVIVKKDDQIKRGDKIATVGQTGEATGPHLHFALSRSGWFVNPESYMEVVLDLN